MGMKELVEALRARRQRALAMGGPEAIAKQHAEGKLTVRERIDRLFDPGSFQEIGLLATHADISPAMKGKETPADGVVTGFAGSAAGPPPSSPMTSPSWRGRWGATPRSSAIARARSPSPSACR
jgi:acetyl-CoA carboxylase carboxyltransferase component